MTKLLVIAFLSVVCVLGTLFGSQGSLLFQTSGRLLSTEHEVKNYNQQSIENFFYLMSPRDLSSVLLVFDGEKFKAHALSKQKWVSGRYLQIIPLLVNSMMYNFPERFQKGQPVFQVVLTVGDYIRTPCVNPGVRCVHLKSMPPILSFSSTYKDTGLLPTVKGFPTPHFASCLYDWRFLGSLTCDRREPVDVSLGWDDLIPTLIWRGSDFIEFITSHNEFKDLNRGWLQRSFSRRNMASMSQASVVDKLVDNWYRLSPRWRAVALTLRAKIAGQGGKSIPWIDAMFTGEDEKDLHAAFEEKGLMVASNESMSAFEMSKYRYQIDLGGGGGTTWQGTLTKLRMPGVLFHHETPTKDWFYDMMKPWIHYIPVTTHLVDLYEKVMWAEQNPEEAKRIAKDGTKLAEYILSEDYMKKVYEELFVSHLGKVIEAYQPEGRNWDECKAHYDKQGVGMHFLSHCGGGNKCVTEYEPNRFLRVF